MCLKANSPFIPTTNDLVAFANLKRHALSSLLTLSLLPPVSHMSSSSKRGCEGKPLQTTRVQNLPTFFFRNSKGEPVNEGVLTMAQGALKHRLGGYERMLSKTQFLAGNKLTVVEFHLPFGEAMIQVRTPFLLPLHF